jgi:3-methylcrotonyl-CoA carboxylase alpha subunit
LNQLLTFKRLSANLAQYHIGPIITNIQFLQSLAVHPDFRAGNVHTGFIKV